MSNVYFKNLFTYINPLLLKKKYTECIKEYFRKLFIIKYYTLNNNVVFIIYNV